MSTTQEQVDLLEAEKLVADDMILEATNQIDSLENAITNQTNLIIDYNAQIDELNVKILTLQNSNQTRDDIINQLKVGSVSLKKEKKGKK